MIRNYCVAGHKFVLDIPGTFTDKDLYNYAPFSIGEELPEGEEPVFSLIATHDPFDLPEGLEPLYTGRTQPGMPVLDLFKSGEGYMLRMASLPGRPLAGLLQCSADFTENVLSLCGIDDLFALNNALMVVYALRTAVLGTLEMHASVVVCEGRGYLFLGPSGTGKSTHSSLWLKHIPGTELLNDDNPVVRVLEDGSVRVYGTPWSGKTPCYRNKDVPVGAIVRLNQAPCNKIERLGPVEAYVSLMGSASGFRPIPEIAEGQHLTREGIVSKVGLYHLDCLPDEQAAVICNRATAHGSDD